MSARLPILLAAGLVVVLAAGAVSATAPITSRTLAPVGEETETPTPRVPEAGLFNERATPPARLGTDPETGEPLPGVIGDEITFRALDKVTAETRDITVAVGEDIRFGSLTLRAHYCRKRPPEEPPEVLALVEVFDRRTDGAGAQAEPLRIFSGWMFASNPALNPLEHPVFDLWPLDCQ